MGYKVVVQTGENNAIEASAIGMTLTVNPGQQTAFNAMPEQVRSLVATGLLPARREIGMVISDFMRELVGSDRFWSKSGKWLGKSLRREKVLKFV